jgi:hypothetical protein
MEKEVNKMKSIEELIDYAENHKDWRIDNASLDNFKYGGKRFEATYIIDCEFGKFEYLVFAEFPLELNGKDAKIQELWKISCAVQLANLFIYSKQKEIDLSFLSKRGELFIRDMISQSTLHLDTVHPGHFTHKRKEWVEAEMIEPYEYNIDMNKKFSIMMSGGKESSAIYNMYHNLGKKCNEDLFAIFIDFIGKIKRRENNSMIHKLKKIGHNPVIIETNIIDLLLFISTKWGTNNLFINIITFQAAMYCHHKGIDYFNMGNEFDTTVANIVKGKESFGQNYEQTTINERKVTKYLQELEINVKLFSPVCHLSETGCQALFTWNDSLGLLEAQNSCVKPVEKDGKYITCNKCDKCLRISAIQTALGMDCTKQGLTYRPEEVWSLKEDIFNSLDSTKETQTIAYLLERQGKFPKEIAKVKPKFNKVTLDFEYDEYHPMILPIPIYNYIFQTLKRVRRDLNVE